MNFLLSIKIGYLKVFRYVKASRSTIYRTLTCFSVLLFLPLIQPLKCLCWFICGHNFTMKFPPDFHNYTRLLHLINRLKAANLTDLQKWKKTSCEKSLLRDVLLKSFPKNYSEITGASCEICEISKNTLFYWTCSMAVSDSLMFPAHKFMKKEIPAKMLLSGFCNILKNTFWQNTSGWMLKVICEFWEVFENTSFIEHL